MNKLKHIFAHQTLRTLYYLICLFDLTYKLTYNVYNSMTLHNINTYISCYEIIYDNVSDIVIVSTIEYIH